MPSKSSTKGKSEKQRKGSRPKEEMPKDQPANTEGETKQAVEEKAPAVVDGPSGKTKDELWEECVSLQEELQRVQRQKLRLRQEAEKCRRAEIEEHEQKLKQLETAHHSEICMLKMAAIATSSKTQKEHAESEVELQKKLHNLQVQQEHDELQKRQTEAVLDVQQKSSLKDTVLETKIKAVTEIQEKEQLKFWVALAFGQGDQMAAKNIKNFDGLMRELTALCISEDNSVQKDTLGPNTAGAESRQGTPAAVRSF